MHDCPWFRLYAADEMERVLDMAREERGDYFFGMLRAWIKGDFSGYPHLASQAEKIQDLSRKRSEAGTTGGNKSSAVRSAASSKSQAKQNFAQANSTLASTCPNQSSTKVQANGKQIQPNTHFAQAIPLSILSVFQVCGGEEEEGMQGGKKTGGREDPDFAAALRDIGYDLGSKSEQTQATAKQMLQFALAPFVTALDARSNGQAVVTMPQLREWLETAITMVEVDGRSQEAIKTIITEVFSMPPAPSNGFTWATHIHSLQDLRDLWVKGKIFVGMSRKNGSSSGKPMPGQGLSPLTPAVDEFGKVNPKVIKARVAACTKAVLASTFPTIDDALAAYIRDTGMQGKTVQAIIESDLHSKQFVTWVKEHFTNKQPSPSSAPVPAPAEEQPVPFPIPIKTTSREVEDLLAVSFPTPDIRARLVDCITGVPRDQIQKAIDSLPPGIAEQAAEQELMAAIYFPA